MLKLKKLQLKKHIQVFVAEKTFIGCDGLAVTDDMRVTIAAQACLLLNRRSGYFPELPGGLSGYYRVNPLRW